MFRLSHRQVLALGLLLNSLAVGFWAMRPDSWRGDLSDGGTALLMGVGIGVMLMALIKKRRAG